MTLPFLLKIRFKVVSPFIIATTISPSSAVFCLRITTRSSFLIPMSIILSPNVRSINKSPFPKIERGSAKLSSIFSTASTGCPQAIEPTSGAIATPLGFSFGGTEMLPIRVLSIRPSLSSAKTYLCTRLRELIPTPCII